jgi:hypothetical protein
VLFEIGGVLGFVLLAFWIWALVDCITADPALVRNLPKLVWLVIVFLLLDIGSVLWLLLGRPVHKHWRPALEDEHRYAPRRPVVVDDHPAAALEISDRRSAELDRRLEAWERQRALELPAAGDDDLDARAHELDEREAELRRRELELRARELDARERSLDED